MVTPHRLPTTARDLSLAELVEQMTSEVESTGSLDFERWIDDYQDWEPVIEELGSLLLRLVEFGQCVKPVPFTKVATSGGTRPTDSPETGKSSDDSEARRTR